MMRSLIVLLLAAVLLAAQGCALVTGKVSSGSTDRRSSGSQVDDDKIEDTAMTRIHEKFKNTAQVTVTCFNRFVLLTGDATTKETKEAINRIVYSVPNVKQIANEIAVGGLSSSSTRHADATISSDIKTELNLNKSLQSGTIKVTTDKGVVYLLGLVTHAEAKTASETASTILGVQKVMRV
jgi:osmotically-inducible protein OsmY